jgi:hypothetical protein
MKLWQGVTLLAIFAAPTGAMALLACGGSQVQPPADSSPPPPPSSMATGCDAGCPPPATSVNQTSKAGSALLRSKLQPCRGIGDCLVLDTMPRCASTGYFWCDASQVQYAPTGQNYTGICVFSLPPQGPTSTPSCSCFEGDIRYCDMQSPGSCTLVNPAGCGVATCLKEDDGGIPPGPAWGPCQPFPTIPPSPVTIGGLDSVLAIAFVTIGCLFILGAGAKSRARGTR